MNERQKKLAAAGLERAKEKAAEIMVERGRSSKIGGNTALAELLGIHRVSVHQWDVVPKGRPVEVEKATGVPRETLRPDLYERDGEDE